MKRRNLLIISALLLSIFALVGNSPITSAAEPTGTLKEIKDRGYIIVGSDTTYPPFENMNEETGLPEGFDVDIIHVIANETLDVKVKFKESAWDPIIQNLKDEKFDIIISAMTINAEREVEVDFTRWYYKSTQAILVTTDNPKNITTTEDLNQTGVVIGVQAGTTSHWYVEDELDPDKVELKTYTTILLAIAALKNGQVDCVLGDLAVLEQDAVQGDTVVEEHFSPEDFGFACRDGDDDLRLALNEGIEALLGTNLSHPVPTDMYNTIYYKWMGVDAFFEIGTEVYTYTGSVRDAVIPYSWQPKAAPGFEILTVLLVIVTIPLLRKVRK